MRLYIDPGTGSMLFTILIGVIGAGIYSARMLLIKLRQRLSGGKVQVNDEKIPFVIFSDDKRYWTTFAPICQELDRRGVDVTYLTASADDPVLHNPYPHIHGEFIGEDNKAFAKLNFLNADIVLSTTPGLDVYQWKRSKQVRHYVHIPHAANDITLYRMFGLDYYDSVLLSGDYQIRQLRQLEQQRGLPAKELVKVGIPYMDVMLKRHQQAGSPAPHETTVLLAPSWGKSALFGVYGGRIIEELLKTGYHVIVRPHPQSFKSEKELMDKLMTQYPASEQLEWNRDSDNFEVLRRADILVSDFSGVIFDFTLVYNKPVLYTNPNLDVSPYDAWWLKEPLWTMEILPKLGCELTESSMQDLKGLIDTCLTEERFAQGRKEAQEQTWAYCGEGAMRTVDFLLAKHGELTKKEEA